MPQSFSALLQGRAPGDTISYLYNEVKYVLKHRSNKYIYTYIYTSHCVICFTFGVLKWMCYEFCALGEPNNDKDSEDCVSIYTRKGTWSDNDCNLKNGFICKKMCKYNLVHLP